jgi:hypothetical protein
LHGAVNESLTRFVGCDAYSVQSLRDELARFMFLLGESDSEGLFSPRTAGALSNAPVWAPPPLLIERRAQHAFSMTTTKAHDGGLGRELASLLGEAEITHSAEGHDYMAPGVDPSHLVSEVVTILGAAGGLGGTAAVLKAFFGRHKRTTVKFGEDGKVLQAAGLSVDDIIRLLDRCSPPPAPDDIWVVRDASDTSGSEKSSPDYMVPDGHSDLAMREARGRSRIGLPQEVVVHGDGESRVIRRWRLPPDAPSRRSLPTNLGSQRRLPTDSPCRWTILPNSTSQRSMPPSSPNWRACSGSLTLQSTSGTLPPPSPLEGQPQARHERREATGSQPGNRAAPISSHATD